MRNNTLYNEAGLMLGFRLGREDAFGEVFRRLQPALVFFARERLGADREAEDIVEDCFIRVWEKRELFYEWPVLKTYLYRAVANASTNWLVRQSKAEGWHRGFEGNREEEFDPVQQIIRAEMVAELSAALNRLPPQRKKIFQMLYNEGMSAQQVADELGLSVHTVYDHRKSGLVFLRKILGSGSFILLLSGLI